MADINSSLDEILRELGDGYDADIAASGRKITRSTANKIWLMLRAFSRGLYGLYQVVAALKYRFDPLYCSDDELESTMRFTGTTRNSGKTSLLSIIIRNENTLEEKTLPAGTYTYASANGVVFSLLLQDPLVLPADSFAKKDFFSSLGGDPYIGSFAVSSSVGINVVNEAAEVIDEELTFDCEDNATQLGYAEETMFEVRQRILTDNQRQEVLHILEERLQGLANIHECTVIANKTLEPVNSVYLQDDEATPVQILPQSLLIIMTGSPTVDFAEQFVSLSPFITVASVGVENAGVVSYPSDIYDGGLFPVHYVPHKLVPYDVVVKYGYSFQQVSTFAVEDEMRDLLNPFRAATRVQSVITTDEFFEALQAYQNPGVKLLSVSFTSESTSVSYMQFNKTQIARLENITFIPEII